MVNSQNWSCETHARANAKYRIIRELNNKHVYDGVEQEECRRLPRQLVICYTSIISMIGRVAVIICIRWPIFHESLDERARAKYTLYCVVTSLKNYYIQNSSSLTSSVGGRHHYYFAAVISTLFAPRCGGVISL